MSLISHNVVNLSHFDFQGTAFSQGGYSAQYGQALSAIVDLKTWSRFVDFNANTFGLTLVSMSYGEAYGNDLNCL